MNIRLAVVFVTSLITLLATASADVATAVATDRSSAEVGWTRIECVADDSTNTALFRGAIIDTGTVDNSYEVIVTAAHGLPSDVDVLRRQCRVLGAKDGRYRIERIWRPYSRGRGSVDDWAVLLTERRLGGHVKRVRTLAIDHADRQRMAGNEIAVSLPLGLVGSERACSLIQPGSLDVDLAVELFGHTCRAWHGHSGSPILTTVEGEVYILGIHLGTLRILQNHASLELGRYVDMQIIETIHAAAAWGRGSGHSERPIEPQANVR